MKRRATETSARIKPVLEAGYFSSSEHLQPSLCQASTCCYLDRDRAPRAEVRAGLANTLFPVNSRQQANLPDGEIDMTWFSALQVRKPVPDNKTIVLRPAHGLKSLCQRSQRLSRKCAGCLSGRYARGRAYNRVEQQHIAAGAFFA